MGPKFGPNGQKLGPKLGFLLVYQVAMLDIKYRFTCGNSDLSYKLLKSAKILWPRLSENFLCLKTLYTSNDNPTV